MTKPLHVFRFFVKLTKPTPEDGARVSREVVDPTVRFHDMFMIGGGRARKKPNLPLKAEHRPESFCEKTKKHQRFLKKWGTADKERPVGL